MKTSFDLAPFLGLALFGLALFGLATFVRRRFS